MAVSIPNGTTDWLLLVPRVLLCSRACTFYVLELRSETKITLWGADSVSAGVVCTLKRPGTALGLNYEGS
jgi:hypothetical protein